MNLSDAITAVETANTAYANGATQITNDKAAAAAIQAKLDAANAATSTDVTAQVAVATTLNSSLDALIAAATAAKVPTA